MAIKRTGSLKIPKTIKCLRCESVQDSSKMKDNKIHECEFCGQKHFVDIYGSKIVLTVTERPELRRRLEKKTAMQEIELLREELEEVRRELKEARKDAFEWREAAEGLARLVEECEAAKNPEKYQ